jgi:MFS family permease
MGERAVSRETARKALPPTVIGLGVVSLLTDLSSDAIFPLLPAFLAALGASNAFIGAIEGAADLVANLLKYATGVVSDRRARLKPLVLAGYGLSTVVRPLVALAAAPWHVLLVRVGDRIGKGVRTSPRDALIANVTEPSLRGRAYGFHRAMDHTGAALGTLLAAGLLWLLGASRETADLAAMRQVFLWAAIPGVFAMVALALTPEVPRVVPPATELAPSDRRLPPALKRALVAILLFSFANATDAFLIVKAIELGAPVALAPLLWLVLHLVKASTGTTGGSLSDRFGRRPALMLGWTVYAVTWGAVGFVGSLPWLFATTAVYGLSAGLVEGAEKALVAELAGGRGVGRAFGAYHMGVGLAALAASTLFGAVWDQFGSRAAFLSSASFALLAALALLLLVPAHSAPRETSGPAAT